MDAALLILLKLRLRAALRRFRRSVKTPRGALLFLVGLLVLVTWFLPSFLMAARGTHSDPTQVRTMFPLALLALCTLTVATSVGEKAIYFTPAEVAFLFSAPFGRRELLAYKLAGSVAGIVFSSFIFSVILMRHTSWWVATYVGVFLSLLFVQLLTMTLLLLSQLISEGAYTRGRKIALVVVLGILASVVWRASASTGQLSLSELARAVQDSTILRYVLLPLQPFGRILTAERVFPDLVGWAGTALAIDAALFGLLMWVDAEYRETAVSVSQRLYSRFQRAQRTGMATRGQTTAARRLPMIRWRAGGAGPVAWRQTLNALRNARSLFILFVFMGVAVVPLFLARADEDMSVIALFASIMVWLTIMLSLSIRFDFRAELDNLEWLKMMPIPASALAVGELAVPVALTTLIQCVPLGALAYTLAQPELFFVVALFLIPANALLFGVENVLFLLFPARIMRLSPGNLQAFGRQLLTMIVKFTLVSLACGIAALSGLVAYSFAGKSELVFGCVAWLVLSAQAVAVVPITAWAYRRFDVTLHMPM